MTTPVASAAQAAQTAQSAKALTSLTSNFETFLTLLTAQLKNQDPLSPLDSNQFTQQLTQMSGVEAQLQGNDLLRSLVNNTGTNVAGAVGLIGKDVKALSDDAKLTGGAATWVYNLDTAASDLKLQISDSTGAIVYAAAPSDKGAGDHSFTWNGKSQDGTKLPDGIYTLKVTAKDSGGSNLTSTTYVQGTVTGVEQGANGALLTINGGQVSLANVISVKNAAVQAASNSTTTGG